MKQFPGLFLLVFAGLFFCSCETQNTTPPAGVAAASRFAQAPTDRPGLGTKWGETRQSSVGFADFVRADAAHPIATASIYYNDAAGIRAMAGAVAWQRTWPILPPPAASLVSVGLKDQSGRFLPGLVVGDRCSSWVKKEGVIQLSSETKAICAWRSFFRWTD